MNHNLKQGLGAKILLMLCFIINRDIHDTI